MTRWLAAIFLLLSCPALAHPARMVAAGASLQADGSFTVRVHFDLSAYLLNDLPARVDDASMNALLDGPAEELQQSIESARQRMLHGVTLICDGKPIRADRIEFPLPADVERWKSSNISPRLPVMQEAIVYGHLPIHTSTLSLKLPEAFGQAIVTIERPGEEPYCEPVEAGMLSTPLPIHLASPVLASVPNPSTVFVLLKYIHSGFIHIVPQGPDHILFVIGLFLLSSRWRDLLWQITAFTLAHSITLAMAMFGVLSLRSSIVEPLIAISIAFIAIENLCTSDLKPWRPFIVFAFGLVHGLGFATVLREANLPPSQFLPAILSFNVGVELGQLSVIAAALLLVGWFRKQDWYRIGIAVPASVAIAMVAVFWTVQRVFT